jgi:hypothetical protein
MATRMIVLASCLAAIAGTPGLSGGPRHDTATVMALTGSSGRWSGDGRVWQPLTNGTALTTGQSIRTGAGTTADLWLPQTATCVRVCPGTTLLLEALAFERVDTNTVFDVELGLRQGRILCIVGQLAAAAKFEVKTRQGVCMVRGTSFAATAEGRVTVLVGVVVNRTAVSLGQGTYIVNPGQTFDPAGNNGLGEVALTLMDEGLALAKEFGALAASTRLKKGPQASPPTPPPAQ